MTTTLAPSRPETTSAMGTDPYSLGFCAVSHRPTKHGEIARYAIGGGRTAFAGWLFSGGFTLVIQDLTGRDLFAGRLSTIDDIRVAVSSYILQ